MNFRAMPAPVITRRREADVRCPTGKTTPTSAAGTATAGEG